MDWPDSHRVWFGFHRSFVQPFSQTDRLTLFTWMSTPFIMIGASDYKYSSLRIVCGTVCKKGCTNAQHSTAQPCTSPYPHLTSPHLTSIPHRTVPWRGGHGILQPSQPIPWFVDRGLMMCPFYTN